MKSSLRLLPLLLLSVLSPNVRADTATRWHGTSNIEFHGTSTLHGWEGSVAAAPFEAHVIMDAKGRPKKLAAEVSAKAAEMDTKEQDRDTEMHKDMKVSANPLITAKMNCNFDRIITSGDKPTQLPFTLTLLGKSQTVEGQIKNWALNGDTATFDLDFELSLKKCGITVPPMLLVIRVGDTVKIHAPVKLVRDHE